MIEIIIQSDDPELQAEIGGLKSQLKYQSISEDIDFLLDDLDRLIFNQDLDLWGAPYSIAWRLTVESYFEHQAVEQLTEHCENWNWRTGELERLVIDMATNLNRLDLVERIWQSCARVARRRFLEKIPDRDRYGAEYPDIQDDAEICKEDAMKSCDAWIAFLEKQGDEDKITDARQERKDLKEENFRKPLDKPAITKMDETQFWHLLADIHARQVPPAEADMALLGALESCSGPALRKAHTIYAKTMRQLYHWNCWALAYAARGGCSDDSFHDFRSWLILQGDPKLVEKSIFDPKSIVASVPKDPDIGESRLGRLLEAAHLARTGRLLKPKTTTLAKPKGKYWEEEDLPGRFPELAAHYDF